MINNSTKVIWNCSLVNWHSRTERRANRSRSQARTSRTCTGWRDRGVTASKWCSKPAKSTDSTAFRKAISPDSTTTCREMLASTSRRATCRWRAATGARRTSLLMRSALTSTARRPSKCPLETSQIRASPRTRLIFNSIRTRTLLSPLWRLGT